MRSDLDRQRLGRPNFVVLKAAIDKKFSKAVGRGANERSELSQAEFDEIGKQFDDLVKEAVEEVFGGKT
jgi:hypothetical protein